MLSKLIYNIITSGIEDRTSPILSRIKLLNGFLLAAAIVMNVTLVYRIFNEAVLSLLLINIGTSLAFWGAFFWLRKTKNIDTVAVFSSIVIISFMITFTYINRNISFGLVWTYMVPFFVVFVAGSRLGLPLIIIYYVCIFVPMYINYDVWTTEGWNKQSLIRYIITSTALATMATISEYTFSSQRKELYLLSKIDEMTNLNNRRSIDQIISYEMGKRCRYDSLTPISLCILDIDDFKSINDTFGHSAGDKVLKEIGGIIKNNVRMVDSVGRWGGEEFCILFPSTSFQAAKALLERLRKNIEAHDAEIGRKVTCSFGLCSTKDRNIPKDRLTMEADKALYRAKKNGKNQICGIEI